jgi:hypothetical protein
MRTGIYRPDRSLLSPFFPGGFVFGHCLLNLAGFLDPASQYHVSGALKGGRALAFPLPSLALRVYNYIYLYTFSLFFFLTFSFYSHYKVLSVDEKVAHQCQSLPFSSLS